MADAGAKANEKKKAVMKKHVFLTGVPGVGKTTLVKRLSEALMASGESVSGFYTEEVRECGQRVGFDVVTLSGQRGRLSRLSGESSVGRGLRVGRYAVDLAAFEGVALPLLRAERPSCAVFVMDEIGRMELLSPAFIAGVRLVLDSSSCVLGSAPSSGAKSLPLVREVQSRPDVLLCEVTRQNREQIFSRILSALHECVKNTHSLSH